MAPASTDSSPAAVVIRDLVKDFGELRAVDGLSLEVRGGECLGLLGPNGAGKTTTLEILIGLQAPTAGEVVVLGQHWGQDDAALRARLGISLQETRFPERLTVREVLALFGSFYPTRRPTEEVLAEVGLEEKAATWTVKLSGGQRQRLALGCALVGDPELLVLDEPTTGFDPQGRLRLGDTIRAYRDRGRTVLLSTHIMEEAQRLCDRVAVVDRGTVIALGAPDELIATLGSPVVVEVAVDHGDLEESVVLGLPGVVDLRRLGDSLLVATSDARLTVPALLELVQTAGVALRSLTTRNATLEDLFLALTGRHLRDG